MQTDTRSWAHHRTDGRPEERTVRTERKHALAECLLSEVLGLEWSKVHREAERWEAVISDAVEERIVELLADPGTCPHGNPIPRSSNRPDQSAAVPLASVPEGLVRVVRIAEELEDDDEALAFLERCGLLPGRLAEVTGRDGGYVEVIASVADASVPPHVAAQTFVEPR